MSCTRCGSNNIKHMHTKLKTVDGTYQQVFKCKFCGYLFQSDKPKYVLFSNRGKQGVPCEVLQIHNGEVINHFESINEASRQTGIPGYSIDKCLLGDSYTAGGFEWIRA